MFLTKIEEYELRTVETATGFSYPLLTGICIWHDTHLIGIVEPQNDVIAKFTCYHKPESEELYSVQHSHNLYRAVNTAERIIESILANI